MTQRTLTVNRLHMETLRDKRNQGTPQGVGMPTGTGVYVIYTERAGEYIGVLGRPCGDHVQTTQGVIAANEVVGFVGPLPAPHELMRGLAN